MPLSTHSAKNLLSFLIFVQDEAFIAINDMTFKSNMNVHERINAVFWKFAYPWFTRYAIYQVLSQIASYVKT